ncbi:MAG: hypothetical protein A2Y36_13140 [Treponema sp. GWA1_62_8]|nr:MAG: hypothetical protein A2Y36_13140 [Treponema sp. GWA1_62_8]
MINVIRLLAVFILMATSSSAGMENRVDGSGPFLIVPKKPSRGRSWLQYTLEDRSAIGRTRGRT